MQLPAVAAATKPFATFEEFYPFYLQQHSEQWTKRLHLMGTLTMVAQLIKCPDLLFALLAAGSLGFAAFPLCRGMSTGLPEFAIMLGTYAYFGRRLTGNWGRTLALPISAYFFAWLGHFTVEHVSGRPRVRWGALAAA